jgi:hypothetical protein
VSRLDEIRARLEAATPGPWVVTKDMDCGAPWLAVVAGDPDEFQKPRDYDRAMVASALREDGHNAALVSNAPADLAYLLGEVERLSEKIERADRGELTGDEFRAFLAGEMEMALKSASHANQPLARPVPRCES